jgi:hypothetical protein
VTLGIKEKRQEKGEEEGCMERKVHIGNKWWKIITIYSKGMKTTRRVEENREGTSTGEYEKEKQEIEKRREGWEKKIQRQGGKCRGEETEGSKKMDGRY